MKTFFAIAFLSIFAFSAQAQVSPTYDLAGRHNGYVNSPAPTATSGPAITVNGTPVSKLNLIGDFDPGTNTLALSRETVTGKGRQAEGNSTVVGTLTVTSGCFLNTHDGSTIFGSGSTPNAGVLALYDGVASPNAHKVTVDVATHAANNTYTIPDAGSNATFSLLVAAPVNSTDAGTSGNFAYDANYFYVCTAANTWVRSALSSW